MTEQQHNSNGTQHRTVDDLIDELAEESRCPGCDKRLADIHAFPARSRFGHGDLCSECGNREAFDGDFINSRARARIARQFKHRREQDKPSSPSPTPPSPPSA